MRTVVTGGGTLDRKSSSVGGGCVLDSDNVDNSTSCGTSGRAIEELNEDEWSTGRYLSVIKWFHHAPNDAVGCKEAQDHAQDHLCERQERRAPV
jgi:hypothetical protein